MRFKVSQDLCVAAFGLRIGDCYAHLSLPAFHGDDMFQNNGCEGGEDQELEER